MSQKIGNEALSFRMSRLEKNKKQQQQQQTRNVSGPEVSRNLNLQY